MKMKRVLTMRMLCYVIWLTMNGMKYIISVIIKIIQLKINKNI